MQLKTMDGVTVGYKMADSNVSAREESRNKAVAEHQILDLAAPWDMQSVSYHTKTPKPILQTRSACSCGEVQAECCKDGSQSCD